MEERNGESMANKGICGPIKVSAGKVFYKSHRCTLNLRDRQATEGREEKGRLLPMARSGK